MSHNTIPAAAQSFLKGFTPLGPKSAPKPNLAPTGPSGGGSCQPWGQDGYTPSMKQGPKLEVPNYKKEKEGANNQQTPIGKAERVAPGDVPKGQRIDPIGEPVEQEQQIDEQEFDGIVIPDMPPSLHGPNSFLAYA